MRGERSLRNRRTLATLSHLDGFLRRLESGLHGMQLYGATGIGAFGWATCRLLGSDAQPWLPLWFCGALLIYNLDRLRHDPSDTVNTPLRAAGFARWRRASLCIATAAAGVLLAWPTFRRDWLTLALVLVGGIVSTNYSVPLLGFRFKDVPYVKTFFAPTVISLAIFGLPVLHGARIPSVLHLAVVVAWSWCFLEFNMILCDLRDLTGDARAGVRSLPVALGAEATRKLLWVVVFALLSFGAGAALDGRFRTFWCVAAIAAPLGLGGILLAARTQRSERFYEWLVEGILFLPIIIQLLTGSR